MVVRTLLGWPLWAGLLAVSVWFPGWYWRRRQAKQEGSSRAGEREGLRLVFCNDFGLLILPYAVIFVLLLRPIGPEQSVTTAVLCIGLIVFLNVKPPSSQATWETPVGRGDPDWSGYANSSTRDRPCRA